MALDIFSNFDDHNKIWFYFSSPLFIWIPLLLVPSIKYWRYVSQQNSLQNRWTSIIYIIVSRTQARKIGMSYSIFIRWTLLVIWLNLTGLVPYVFRMTRHLALNLSLTLPIWVIIVLIRSSFNLNNYLSHFQPIGSPAPLNPFLCLIELVRNLVRPITLAVRLAANLRTGHIMLTLLGTAFTKASLIMLPIILILGTFYTIFEIAICIIQTYIFTLLPTLYTDDHPTN